MLSKKYQYDDLDMMDEYFDEYKNLGGKKNKKKYHENLDIFFEETYDLYIDGDTTKHQSREDANWEVIEKANISVKEFNLIFDSVDNVTAYT